MAAKAGWVSLTARGLEFFFGAEVGHPESGFVQSDHLIFDAFGDQIRLLFGTPSPQRFLQLQVFNDPCVDAVIAVGLEIGGLFKWAILSLLLSVRRILG